MEINMKSMVQIGLIIIAVMFVMKMMKGKRRYEGFSQEGSKVQCNCNIDKISENFEDHEKLNIINDLSKVNAPNNILYINTLPEPYHVCNLTKDENGSAVTVNNTKDIVESDHCALYCAHKDSGSALKYYKENEDLILKNCENVHYLKGGAKDLLTDGRFDMKDKNVCDNKINNKN